ncbi:MAG: hypothetical protein P8183_14645, partial [Anaerolineae bacterium]
TETKWMKPTVLSLCCLAQYVANDHVNQGEAARRSCSYAIMNTVCVLEKLMRGGSWVVEKRPLPTAYK